MKYCLMTRRDDEYIPNILASYRLPSIAHFVNINEENYWQYVTSTENVWFYKIFDNNCLVATIHLERPGCIMYMDIVVFPKYQKNGIATKILNDIQSGKLGHDFEKIHVSIDVRNIASIKLFETAGFVCIGKDDELLQYEYVNK